MALETMGHPNSGLRSPMLELSPEQTEELLGDLALGGVELSTILERAGR